MSSFAKDSIACFIVPVSSAYPCNSFRASYVVLHKMATKVKQLLERNTRYVWFDVKAPTASSFFLTK